MLPTLPARRTDQGRLAPKTLHIMSRRGPRGPRQAHASGVVGRAQGLSQKWALAVETGLEGRSPSPERLIQPSSSKADANSWWTPSLNIQAADSWALQQGVA